MLSRIGRLEAHPEDVDLTSLATEIADEFGPRFGAATVRIGALPVITMSPLRARQLLTNVLDNAFTHSGRDDVTVDIGARPGANGDMQLWVADDGRGVPPRDRERAFGVFERLDERPTGAGGTGVGLSACRRIVEHLGGTIRLGDVDRGTRVEIALPAAVIRRQVTEAGARR